MGLRAILKDVRCSRGGMSYSVAEEVEKRVKDLGCPGTNRLLTGPLATPLRESQGMRPSGDQLATLVCRQYPARVCVAIDRGWCPKGRLFRTKVRKDGQIKRFKQQKQPVLDRIRFVFSGVRERRRDRD